MTALPWPLLAAWIATPLWIAAVARARRRWEGRR